MKKIAILFFPSACLLLLFAGCGSDNNSASSGIPPTEETILGKWFLKTYSLDGEVDISIALFQLDTTAQIDTSGAFPDGDYYEFKADGSYESNVNVDFEAMLQDAATRFLGKISTRPVETGTWHIQGEQLAMVQAGDTTLASAKINGNNITVSSQREISESQQGFSAEGMINFVFTGSK